MSTGIYAKASVLSRRFVFRKQLWSWAPLIRPVSSLSAIRQGLSKGLRAGAKRSTRSTDSHFKQNRGNERDWSRRDARARARRGREPRTDRSLQSERERSRASPRRSTGLAERSSEPRRGSDYSSKLRGRRAFLTGDRKPRTSTYPERDQEQPRLALKRSEFSSESAFQRHRSNESDLGFRSERTRLPRDREPWTDEPRWQDRQRPRAPSFYVPRSSLPDDVDTRDRRRRVLPLSIPYTTPSSDFLYGTSVVSEALRSSRRKVYALYLHDGQNQEEWSQRRHAENLAKEKGVRVSKLPDAQLMNKLSKGRPHNGCILEASPLAKLPVVALAPVEYASRAFAVELDHQTDEDRDINGANAKISTSGDLPRYPLVILLDGVLDPGNVGSIIRTAHFLGADAIALSQHNAPLGSVALKASAGAAEILPLIHIRQPPSFIEASRQRGWRFYAAAPPRPEKSGRSDGQQRQFDTENLGFPLLTHPSVLMLGNEGLGLSPMLQSRADYLLSIKGDRSRAGGVDSLNVSVAAGLLCDAFKPLAARRAEKELF